MNHNTTARSKNYENLALQAFETQGNNVFIVIVKEELRKTFSECSFKRYGKKLELPRLDFKNLKEILAFLGVKE